MNTKIPPRLRSSLAGLVGVTAFSLVIGADSAAQAASPPPVAPRAAKLATAGAAKNRFLGAHPLAGNPGTGYCYIDVPHVHDYVPDRPAVFQQVNDEYVFTGDPVPYGYEGDKTVFYGHHPVPMPVGVNTVAAQRPTFCFIKGPHYHDYPLPEAPGFKQKDNAVFYVGPIPPEVARERPQIERAVEVEYQPYVAQRPQVVVNPPPEWQGPVWVAPPPSVVVHAPQPALLVAPPSPQVVIAPPSPQVVVAAPAPPTVVVAAPHPSVVVVPPHPPAVVIGVQAPGVIFMGGRGHGHGWGHGRGHWKGGGRGWKGGKHW